MDISKIVKKALDRKAQQKTSELTGLLEMLTDQSGALPKKKKNLRILEIGAYDGGCTYAFSQFGKVTSIDLVHRGPEIKGVEYISGDSHSKRIIDLITSIAKFDFIFIDGDHTYDGVKLDYENFSPALKEGGIIAFHDILDSDIQREWQSDCEVHKFWNEVKEGKRFVELIAKEGEPDRFGGGYWGGIGVLFL